MILVLNCGSQSFKWKLFNNDLILEKSGKTEVLDTKDYNKILQEELEKLLGNNISLIGHRIVHGGNIFLKPSRITNENIKDLEKISHLAPLHNPYGVMGIKTCQKIFPLAANIAVFDTEFFQNLPEYVSIYALPEEISKNFGFKRYGFHGISHEYVASVAIKNISKKRKKIKRMITVHLGGGASVAAIKNGKAIDVSMGFTPLEGIVMMTRSGNIDAGIVLHLAKELSIEKANEILNKHSGLKGICGESDMLKILEKIKMGDKKSKLAFDVFIYSIKKYIGAYFAVLGGCDVLVFTGAIGAGDSKIRNSICRGLNILKNTKILTIHTDEELAIAQKII